MAPSETILFIDSSGVHILDDSYSTFSNRSAKFYESFGEACGRILEKDINPKLPIKQPETWPDGRKRKPWEVGMK